MARARVYRPDQQCPRCGSNWRPKDGKSPGKQTYRCGQCLCYFTEGKRRPPLAAALDRIVALAAAGMSLAALSRGAGTFTTPKCSSVADPLAPDADASPRVKALKTVVLPACGRPIMPMSIG